MAVFLLTGCTVDSSFVVGAVEKNTSTQMSMSYRKFDGYKQRKFEVKEGAPVIVSVEIETESGNLDAYIAKDNSKEDAVYEGHDIPDSSFTVTVSEPGEYTIRVEGEDHSGSYSFSWE